MFQQVTKVVSYYFAVIILLPYYFLPQKSCCIGVFVSFYTRFSVIFQCFFRKNRKKSANFLQFFLVVYQ